MNGQAIPAPISIILGGTPQGSAADAGCIPDESLPEQLRPWLDLDALRGDPKDTEGWVCLPYAGRYLVARLGEADGPFGPTRALAWPLDVCVGDFDPGLYLGRRDLFACRPEDAALPAALPPPGLAEVALVATQATVAERLLAHLFQGMLDDRPVAMAVPMTAFASTASLAPLVALARAALPAGLRRRCRLRIFARHPERFLAHDGAHLLVIPKESASAVLAARRDATLLDLRGERLAGPEPVPALLSYAAGVIAAAVRFPHALAAFGERFDRLWSGIGPPDDTQTDLAEIIYKLAVTLEGTEAQRGQLFNYMLVDQARDAELPWADLVCAEEWLRFPREPQALYLLRPRQGLTPGEGRLQEALGEAFAAAGTTLDRELQGWWSPHERGKRGRLLELAATRPPLVSPQLTAELCADIPLRTLAADGPIEGLLSAELEVGVLAEREREADIIAEHAGNRGVFRVLRRAAREGALAATWLTHLLEHGSGPDLLRVAMAMYRHPQELGLWGDAPNRLTARLNELGTCRSALVPQLFALAENVDAADHPEAFLGLASIIVRADPTRRYPLLAQLWPALDAVSHADRQHRLLSAILGGTWDPIGPDDLIDPHGGLRPRWAERHGAALLAAPGFTDRLPITTLIHLAGSLDAADAHARQLYGHAVLLHMIRDAVATTAALVRQDAWYDWRRYADPDPRQVRAAALAWLSSPALAQHRREGSRGLPPQWHRGRDPERPPPEPTMEAWRQVLADLADGGLTAEEIYALSGENRHWPWIYPFEEEQVRALEALCTGAAARRALKEALDRRPDGYRNPAVAPPPSETPHQEPQ